MPTFSDVLTDLNADHRLRSIPDRNISYSLDLSSNDYLSLGASFSDHRQEFLDRFSDAAFSSSASRLLSVNQKYHYMLEDYLQELYGKPALLFNSGYHANVGCIGALTIPSTLFVCDKLIHASVVDGLHVAQSQFKRFPHNDLHKLRTILEKETSNYETIIVVVESLYSMDGDEAPLKELVELKREFPGLLLYVDEAHAFGVRGEKGLGISEELGLTENIDILVGTLGKAAASAGAFAVVSPVMKSLLINCARPFIFSTALPPVNMAWSILMIEKIVGMKQQRFKLKEISQRFSQKLECISGKPTGSSSQIIPYLTGNAENALFIAGKLRDNGIIALPIRRPTVPPGGERIRFSLGAGMEWNQFDPVFKVLEDIADAR